MGMSGLIRVFPRRTKATPKDALAYVGPPDLYAEHAEADEVHVSVAFTQDKPIAERLAEEWRRIAPVKVGGVAYGDDSLVFIPGRYIKPGYTITSRGCPRRCWFCGVWKKWPEAHPLTIHDGWNVLDDNLLACPEWHVRAVFDMLRTQTRRVEFTGGLEALALQDYQGKQYSWLSCRSTGQSTSTLEITPTISCSCELFSCGFVLYSEPIREAHLMGGATVNTYLTVEHSGVYVCGTCGDNQEVMHKGDEAPRCCNCKRPVTWLYHRQLMKQPIGFTLPY